MKYKDKYKDLNFEDLNKVPDSTLLYMNNARECAECREPTHFIDYCWESVVCSEECEKAIHDKVMKIHG